MINDILQLASVLPRVFAEPVNPDLQNVPDLEFLDALAPFARAIRAYFRAEVHGLDRMPRGKALLVGNHNSGVTFLEPFMLSLAWYELYGHAEPIHYLGHDVIVDLPYLGKILSRCGVVRATHDGAAKVFELDRKVSVFPGGNYEAFRTFRERHRVDFAGRTGFVKLAIKHEVPIVPMLSLGGHNTFMVLCRGERLARLLGLNRIMRSRAFPLYLGLPWGVGIGPIFHLPLPVKLLVEVGDPIYLDDCSEEDLNDKEKMAYIARSVESKIQGMMDRRVGTDKPTYQLPSRSESQGFGVRS